MSSYTSMLLSKFLFIFRKNSRFWNKLQLFQFLHIWARAQRLENSSSEAFLDLHIAAPPSLQVLRSVKTKKHNFLPQRKMRKKLFLSWRTFYNCRWVKTTVYCTCVCLWWVSELFECVRFFMHGVLSFIYVHLFCFPLFAILLTLFGSKILNRIPQIFMWTCNFRFLIWFIIIGYYYPAYINPWAQLYINRRLFLLLFANYFVKLFATNLCKL